MKGVKFVIDSRNRKKAVIVDLKTIERHADELEDFLLGIIAASRGDEQRKPLKAVIKKLKKKGKL